LFAYPFGVLINTGLTIFMENTNFPLGLLFFLMLLGVPYTAFILGPVHTALFYQMNQVINNEGQIRGFWEGLRKHYWLSVRVYALYTAMIIFCLVDLVICFFTLKALGMKILGFFLLYLLLFLVFWFLYLPGFIVFQKNTLKKVLHKTFVLVLDNIWLTIGALLLLVVIGVLFTLITPLLVSFYGSLLLVLMVHLFNGIMMKYPDPVAPVQEEGE
jgi:uncharacterized membrane protein YesL